VVVWRIQINSRKIFSFFKKVHYGMIPEKIGMPPPVSLVKGAGERYRQDYPFCIRIERVGKYGKI
jgi:hypothetical protein